MLPADQQIFQTDAVLSGQIDARLIGGDHTLLKDRVVRGIRSDFPAEAVGTLVAGEQIADAVTGAVVEIQTQLPQRRAGEQIQIDAGTARTEDRGGKIQVAAQDGGIVSAHGVGDRTERDGSCDVGGSLEVLSAGVQQEESLRTEFGIALRCCGVVDDGAVRAVCRDGIKTRLKIMPLFLPELLEPFGGADLGDRYSADVLLEPMEKPHERGAVCAVCLVDVADFGRILDRFGQLGGRDRIHQSDAFGQGGDQCGACTAPVELYGTAGQRGQMRGDVLIGETADAVVGERVADRSGKCIRLDKQTDTVL